MKSKHLFDLLHCLNTGDIQKVYECFKRIKADLTNSKQLDLVAELERVENNFNIKIQKQDKNLRGLTPLNAIQDSNNNKQLVDVYMSTKTFADIILNDLQTTVFNNIVKENKNKELLLKNGLRPIQKLLLYGPPGNGKTTFAETLANSLEKQFVLVRYDNVVSSFLGETSKNLRQVFDIIKNNNAVILFDEFDAIGKKRDDPQEHGEIKRVVNSFMMMLDTCSTESVLVFCTNHERMLDNGIWRRFDEILKMDCPLKDGMKLAYEKYLQGRAKNLNIDLIVENSFYDDLHIEKRLSFSAIKTICDTVIKNELLNGEKVSEDRINSEIYRCRFHRMKE